MIAIKCQNVRKTSGGDTNCNRILVGLPKWVIDGLRERQGTADGAIITRCPSCPRDGRFAETVFVDDKLTFRVIAGENLFDAEIKYDDLYILRQDG